MTYDTYTYDHIIYIYYIIISYSWYNRNTIRRVHINMVTWDNAQTRRVRAFLFPFLWVNSHVVIDTENGILLMRWALLLKKIGNIYRRLCREISNVILPGWYCPAYCFNHVIHIYDTGENDCTDEDGSYNGQLAISVSGRQCLNWFTFQFAREYTLAAYGAESWDEVSNYCR